MKLSELLLYLENNKVNGIENVQSLIESLRDLDSMIGMENLKDSFVKQIIYLIQVRQFDMLNTVIYGPPGTGKTKLCQILCKIWKSIGILPKKNECMSETDDILDNIEILRENASDAEDVFSLTKIYNYIVKNNYNPIYVQDSDFVVVSREDFIGLYQGHTTEKTLKLLNSCLGKVLFIDEAYSLINDEKDMYGMEALTTLNLFMSQHPREIIVIFAGYKDLMENSIFKYQPGLQRRCTWVFEVDVYNRSDLYRIFMYQISEEKWSIHDVTERDFNVDDFPGYGGDTKKLFFYCKLEQSMIDFGKRSISYNISRPAFKKALEVLKSNQAIKRNNSRDKLSLMYN